MQDSNDWQSGLLIKRYKRFLADVCLPDGREITIHCPNTGSMKNCILPESRCWFSRSDNPKRKYPNTWEVATTPSGALAGINTHRANALVGEALAASLIDSLAQYSTIQPEVKYGAENSRIDFLLSHNEAQCYVEVKNVTLMDAPGQGMFPDAVSTRGTKHLRELMAMVDAGHRAVLLYCVQHNQIEWVEPAACIDPDYAQTLRQAMDAGVEVLAYKASIQPEQSMIKLTHEIPVQVS